ncbi:breast carcinoma-amplified sequence 1 isoform X3 [Acipenser oxyrinchus oxyrinchus]|uniref:Breast carcinoma-amplified sequence 1 isoform X3 n=1 Tax=Acipenser oxyrinchus oxyrinchus TaxID=40147 RepID=A0AAD8CG66_ACIOX|nr:breast carcinoma-amplified sequence 1 isoform X3 [Acipenser oxyrinchus oxyrinchus]
MGNELSATENAEGNEGEAFENGIQVEPIAGKLQNGGARVQPIEISVSNDVADCKADVKQNTELSSSQKTMEMSSSSGQDGNNAGKNAKKTMPAAKSRFSLSFSTPVPVRSEAPTATDSSSSSEPAKPSSGPENPPANQFTAEKTVHPQLSAPERESVKLEKRPPSQSLLPDVSLKESKEVPKPKEIGFFDKLFKTSDKEKESSKPVDETQPELNTEGSKGPAATATANEVVQVQLNNAQRAEPGEGSSISVRLQNSQSEATDRTRDSTEDTDRDQDSSGDETASEDNPVMNFFKTLVSPSKSSKSDSESQDSPKEKKKGLDSKEAMAEKEQKASKVEKAQASLPVAQQLPAKPETQPAKEQESPGKQKTDKESSPSPFSKLFRQKSMKEGSQAVDTKANQGEQEAEAAPDVKAVKAVPSQSAKGESKGTESATKSQKSGQAEGQQEGQQAQTQQKPAKEATASPFSKLFKQKVCLKSIQRRVEVDAPATTTVTSNTKTAENSTTAAKEGDESKPAKSTFMSFFKPLSVREEEKVALEVNGKDSDQTRLGSKSKATAHEKPSAAPEAEEKAPSPEVSKKKSGKQESLQKPKVLEASQDSKSVSEASQNGEEITKDAPRRLEKRPSIGGFFKGLGSKRMSDVGVQTDPVCISPAQKAK